MPMTNLPFIQRETTRYGMSAYLVLGFVGNVYNCIIFTRPLYRRTSSSIYLVSGSIFAILYLFWSLVPTIYTLDHTDPQTQSFFFCKVRFYGTHVLGQYLRYGVVLISADRFLATRTSVRLRSLNSVPLATKVVLIMCAVWMVAGIHLPIMMDINNGVCGMFGLYKLVYAVYQTTVASILPIVLLIIFSVLTIRSLYRRHGAGQVRVRQRDRYLMRMVIAEVIVDIIVSIPYSSILVYNVATYYVVGKSALRLEIEAFIYFIAQFLIYLTGAFPFYLFLLTSKPFRNEFIKLFVNCWKKCNGRRVRVLPFTGSNTGATNRGGTNHERQ